MRNSTLLTGVTTQGRPTMKEEWVESFKIMYGESEEDLQYMTSANGTVIVSIVTRSLDRNEDEKWSNLKIRKFYVFRELRH